MLAAAAANERGDSAVVSESKAPALCKAHLFSLSLDFLKLSKTKQP